MNESFTKYMTTIGLTAPLVERVTAFYGFCTLMCPEKMEHMFINDYVNKEGMRIFESLYFFSPNYALEAKEFATTDNYDMGIVEKPLPYLTVEFTDFDLKKATDKSRMSLSFRVSGAFIAGVYTNLKASRENC